MKRTTNYFKVLVFALVIALAFVFVGCGEKESSPKLSDKERNDFVNEIGGASETFTGATSKEVYQTKEDAAKAFIAEEVVGEKKANVVSVESKAVLNEESVNKLGIPEEDKAGIVSVEEVEVTYAAVSGLVSSEPAQKITVYVIKYETNWKYFVPLPETGATISKTYYESVFDTTKFANSTYFYELTMDMDIKMTYQGQTQKGKMTTILKQDIKYDEGRIYAKQYVLMDMSAFGQGKEEVTVEMYIEEVDGRMVCYIKNGYGWQQANLSAIGFNTLEELQPFANDYLDYTYFTKTAYGFELNKENGKKYAEQALGQTGVQDLLDGGNMDMDMYAEYFVNEGALSGILLKGKLSISMSEEGVSMTMSGDMEAKGTCTNYGTTVVEKPF